MDGFTMFFSNQSVELSADDVSVPLRGSGLKGPHSENLIQSGF